MVSKKIIIPNPSGLHARPAGTFVKTAGHYKSTVNIIKNGKTYNAKSILTILSACIKCQEEIELEVSGPDENEALTAIVSAVKNGLGEQVKS